MPYRGEEEGEGEQIESNVKICGVESIRWKGSDIAKSQCS